MKTVNEFLISNDNFAIICHTSPDGDTLGSGLALYHGLKQIGKKCNIYCNDTPEKIFNILEGLQDIKFIGDIKEKNLVFCDCSDENRALFEGDLSQYNVLNIDHHISNTRYGNVNMVCDKACATCQVMYSVLTDIGVALDKTIAKCLYVGLCTDTNNFSNSNVDDKVFSVASCLAKHDFCINEVVKVLFRTKSYAKTLATARFIDRMQMFFDNKFCLSYLSLEDINELQPEDTEGFVDIAVDIEGVSVACFLKEKEKNVFKVSLRSNYDVDVCEICNAFGGGGHIKASGCCINGTVQEVIDAICNEVKKWME